MRRNQAVIFALAFSLSMAGPVAAQEESKKAITRVQFRVENPKIEIGRVQAGKEGVFVFVFQNDSEVDVKILRAKPT